MTHPYAAGDRGRVIYREPTEEDNTCPKTQHRDGESHGWRFDLDNPYIVCDWCGQWRDAISGCVLVSVAATPKPRLIDADKLKAELMLYNGFPDYRMQVLDIIEEMVNEAITQIEPAAAEQRGEEK
jgi:hypothetical protein